MQPFADLLMREMVAVFQSVLAAFDGFDEAVLFFEIAGNNVLHKLVRVPALLVRMLSEAGLQLGFEIDLHAFTIGDNQSAGNVVLDELRGAGHCQNVGFNSDSY